MKKSNFLENKKMYSFLMWSLVYARIVININKNHVYNVKPSTSKIKYILIYENYYNFLYINN